MPIQEEKIQQTFEDIEREAEKRKASPLKFFTRKAFLWIGIAILVLWWMYGTQKLKFNEILVIFAIILLVLYMMGQKQEEAGYLTDDEAKAMLGEKLRHKQIYTDEVPDGKITVDMRTKEPWIDYGQGMKPQNKREIGFSVTDRNTGLKEYFVAEVNISKADRPGDIISIADCPGKFDGKMSRDIKVVMSSDIWKEKKYQDLMRKK